MPIVVPNNVSSWEEIDGSPTYTVERGNFKGTRIFHVPWGERDQFVGAILGSYRAAGGGIQIIGGVGFPGVSPTLATSVAVKPFAEGSQAVRAGNSLSSLSSGVAAYELAEITVGYELLKGPDFSNGGNSGGEQPPETPEGTFLTLESDLSAEYMTVPARCWHWDDAGGGDPALETDFTPGILIPCETLNLSWHFVPRPPHAAIKALRGKINSAEWFGHPAGTCLFLGARRMLEISFGDTASVWKIDYSFQIKEIQDEAGSPITWNHFYREEAVGGTHWIKIKDEDDNYPYKSGDFTSLFQF